MVDRSRDAGAKGKSFFRVSGHFTGEGKLLSRKDLRLKLRDSLWTEGSTSKEAVVNYSGMAAKCTFFVGRNGIYFVSI